MTRLLLPQNLLPAPIHFVKSIRILTMPTISLLPNLENSYFRYLHEHISNSITFLLYRSTRFKKPRITDANAKQA